MAPAFGRRTPQKPLQEGRPKRQAVLNRKNNLEIANGVTSSSKKEPEKKVTTTVSSKKIVVVIYFLKIFLMVSLY